MNIGNITLPKTAGLAPMAGVGDRAFREICKEFGCAYVVSEMASSKGLTFQGTKTEELLFLSGEGSDPAAIQLFGDDPQIMAEAAKLAMKFHPDVIDINMAASPAPRGGGQRRRQRADEKILRLPGQIVKAVCEAVEVPVTVKFRKGWDEKLGQRGGVCQDHRGERRGGAVHPRAHPPADVRPQCRLGDHPQGQGSRLHPVMGNGDVTDAPLLQADVRRDRGGLCDDRPRGRRASPGFFRADRPLTCAPASFICPTRRWRKRWRFCCWHIRLLCDYKGEKIGMKGGAQARGVVL